MDTLKRIFSKAIVMVVLAILAIASVTATVFINVSYASKKNAIVETTNVEQNEEAETPTKPTTSVDIKKTQQEALNSSLIQLSSLSQGNKTITDVIDSYIKLRYNYTDAPDKEYILKELSGITRKAFLGTVDNSLNYLTGSSKASVIKRYFPVKYPSASSTDEYSIEIYIYVVDINGEYRVIEYTMYSESGVWKIYAEKEIDTIDAEKVKSEELLTPNTSKADEQTKGSQTGG